MGELAIHKLRLNPQQELIPKLRLNPQQEPIP